MRKEVSFQLEDAVEIPGWTKDYPEYKYTVFKACFLSTAKNSHELNISSEVLKRDASTILGSFLVAKIEFGDAKSHELDEIAYGYAPMGQEIEFIEDEDSLKAYCYFVVSKRYGKELNDIFEFDNIRKSSVEMTVETYENSDTDVLSLDIYGLTCLNKRINGSCPDADIKMVRFSQEEAEKYFGETDKLSQLKTFAKERKQSMAENKTYKVDKSKEAMVDTPWEDVDKTKMRNKIMEASNKASLVKDVYLYVGKDWETNSSGELKYPVMQLKGDTFVYNRAALGAAKARAVQNNEDDVINKLEKIYKKLGLDKEDGKEEDKKMAKEVEFAAVDIGDMWGKVYETIRRHDAWEYSIEGIYEEDNKKFAVLRERGGDLFRLDFSLTEEGMTVADEVVAVAKEFVEKDEIKKFAEPENADKFKKFEDDDSDDDGDDDDEGKEVEMSCDEMKAKMAQMQADIESRDNIIMEKDTELADLRAFKSSVEEKEKAMSVEAVMADIKEFVDDGKYKELRDEGLACEFAALDGWKNTARAVAFEASKGKTTKKSDGVWRMSGVIETPKVKNRLWD